VKEDKVRESFAFNLPVFTGPVFLKLFEDI